MLKKKKVMKNNVSMHVDKSTSSWRKIQVWENNSSLLKHIVTRIGGCQNVFMLSIKLLLQNQPLDQHLRYSLLSRASDIHPPAPCGTDSTALGPALLL